MAAAAGAGAGGVLYLPYLLGERAPLWDARLKGAFLGLTGSVRRGDLARSVLEGVAYHMNSIFQRILAVNGLSPPESLRMVGGGAQSRLWRQIFADVFGVPVTTSEDSDHAGVLGAAALAGTALGVYRDVGVVRDFQRQVSLTRPDPEAAESYRVRYPIFLEAQEALRQVNHKLWALGEKRS
jgi:xylulokinase